MPKPDVQHLPLTGESNPDQLDIEGRVMKRATSPLILERATQLAEALDALEQEKANVEFRDTELDSAFERAKTEQFVDATTLAGSIYRFYPSSTRKIAKKRLVAPSKD